DYYCATWHGSASLIF
nr:immunoglobulin light chain junction region [Macaca mulatta]MOX69751.1 immunoglobulin light chain junction region [Macaca mulatta]MOX69791.1 immunoglobulin light chain junction region [Macaca mulatta]MOX70142.1 immunoglobulin light chain junction region [Macaca mulatta]MOX70182.1 immunoglobulin light chain junction region [Macaca mulatta]